MLRRFNRHLSVSYLALSRRKKLFFGTEGGGGGGQAARGCMRLGGSSLEELRDPTEEISSVVGPVGRHPDTAWAA